MADNMQADTADASHAAAAAAVVQVSTGSTLRLNFLRGGGTAEASRTYLLVDIRLFIDCGTYGCVCLLPADLQDLHLQGAEAGPPGARPSQSVPQADAPMELCQPVMSSWSVATYVWT